MKAAEAAALAETYARHITDQAKYYSRCRPMLAVPYFLWCAQSATNTPLTLTPQELDETTTRLMTAHPSEAVAIVFTGQDCGTLALWEQHRTVYTVDSELWAALGDTEDATMIPAGLYEHLPHADPFIAFPEPLNLPLPDGKIHQVGGFFITGRQPVIGDGAESAPAGVGHLQRSTHHGGSVGRSLGLLFIGLVFNPDGSRYWVSDQQVQDAIYSRVSVSDGQTVGEMIEMSRRTFLSADESEAWEEHVPMMMRRAMSLIVYLCATNADLRPVAVPPVKVKMRSGKTQRRKDVKRARVVEVGYRVGAALRAHRASEAAQRAATGTRRHARPHVRRAHFHTFWVGPGRPGERTEKRVKWLPPIPINIEGPATKPTVHRVGAR